MNNGFLDCYSSAYIQKPSALDHLNIELASDNPLSIINYEDNAYDRLFLDVYSAIDSGCQCWIMEAEISTRFFVIFEELLHKHTLQRPFKSKVLVYGLNMNYTDHIVNPQILDIFNKSLYAGEYREIMNTNLIFFIKIMFFIQVFHTPLWWLLAKILKSMTTIC